MSNVLIISGHPDLTKSMANKLILEDLSNNLPGVEIHRLDQLYPDYRIDIQQEQQALLKADLIIWQFPIYWYGIPALLKKWLEEVFAHGFAYGAKGNALRDKKLLLSATAGAPLSNYAHDGLFKKTVEEFFSPYEAACVLCGIKYLPPIYSGGMMYIPGVSSEDDLLTLKQQARAQAQKICEVIKAL